MVRKSPLQNRVDPAGQLHADPSKEGVLMGNRGILHDGHKEIVRQWNGKSWVACDPKFPKFGKRKLFQERNYSELFFLDEATAYSAGHRPCWTCRPDRYDDFKSRWKQLFSAGTSLLIKEIDAQLHSERAIRGGGKVTYQAKIGDLPDGTFIEIDGSQYLLSGKRMLQWSFAGYVASVARNDAETVTVLTPRSIVELFRRGLVPMIHSSSKNFL